MTLTGIEQFRIVDVDDALLADAAAAEGLALSVEELRRIAEVLGRDPSFTEIHAFDAQWSEHCSYKSSRPLLKALPTTGPDVILGPAEDAGILRLGEWNGSTYGIVIAHESHNHPSQLVPFEGAATGIGGIVRDVLCMGATVIAVADPLRFGRIDGTTPQADHAWYVARNAVRGIGAYGNAIGVPNIAGDVCFHEGFNDNCLVNVVALGLVRDVDIIHSHAPKNAAGWDIILVGKATDRSGFGGASFSSVVLDADDDEGRRGAVQVPDPFLKNVVMRASYRVFEMLREEKIVAGFKDLGAGGIMGCTAEITSSGGFGAEIDLDAVLLAHDDLPAPVIAIGETQERLTWVVPREITARVLAIYNEEYSLPLVAKGAGASVIGKVTEATDYVLRHKGREVMRVPTEFLCGDVRIARVAGPVRVSNATNDAPADADLTKLPDVLAHRDVCSRRPIYERYDSVVRGTTAIPAGYGDAGVIVPIPGAPLGVALSVDGIARYGVIDARRAAALAVCESVRNVASVGARPVGLTDCLNFGNPQRPEHYGELVTAIDGLSEAARALALPFVSGNVSLYNEGSNGNPVPASAIIACVGAFADVSIAVTSRFQRIGSAVYLIGKPQTNLGGSVYAELCGIASDALPEIVYEDFRAELALVRTAFDGLMVLSAHDISDGGLLTTLAEMCFDVQAPGTIGLTVDAMNEWVERIGSAGVYFGEAGAIVCEIDATHEAAFLAAAAQHAAAVTKLGITSDDATLRVADRAWPVSELFVAWDAPLGEYYP